MDSDIFTIDQVRAWLTAWVRSEQRSQPVGVRGSAGCCPLSNVLRALTDEEDVAVWVDGYRVGNHTYPMDMVLGDFVCRLDARGPRGSVVMADEALALLDEVVA
jgi:hypothetical protein